MKSSAPRLRKPKELNSKNRPLLGHMMLRAGLSRRDGGLVKRGKKLLAEFQLAEPDDSYTDETLAGQ